jgi:hypothetical protein
MGMYWPFFLFLSHKKTQTEGAKWKSEKSEADHFGVLLLSAGWTE